MTTFDLMPWLMAWVTTTLVVLVLGAYRKRLDRLEDTDLHLGVMTAQEAEAKVAFNRRLHRTEFAGKSFTVLLAVLSVVVAALWANNLWIRVYMP
jgi:hypothetical protein